MSVTAIETPISVTTTAAGKIAQLLSEENKTKAGLRVFVQGGGCSGFSYIWDFSEGPLKEDEVIDIGSGISLIIDGMSVMYTLGSKIDYVKELGGTYLKVSNPMADSQCGCGESFSVKV